MGFYTEIKLLPNSEFSATVLMNTVFSKLHLAFVKLGEGKIGISFPKYNKTLGEVIRLHGQKHDLEAIIAGSWRKGFKDYIEITEISPIPKNCKYRVVKRLQPKSNVERLYRRSVRKGRITQEEAKEKIATIKCKFVKTPFVQMKSLSTGKHFRLFIEHGKLSTEAKNEGVFSAYGLSNKKTIPWF